MNEYVGTVGERGQVTIPQALRRRYGLRKGTKVIFDVTTDGIVVSPQPPDEDPVWSVFGCLNKGIDTDAFISELRDE